MRIKWIVLGVGGISAAALGSANFTTVINQGDPISGDSNSNTFAAPVQVVVGADGSIGSISADSNGDEYVILSSYSGSWTNQDVVGTDAPATVSGLTGPQTFDQINSLAFTNPSGGDRLNFSVTDGVGNVGILQADKTGSSVPLSNVAYNGVNGFSFNGNDATDSGSGPIEFNMNGSGNAFFEANGGVSLWLGNSSTQTKLFQNNGTLSVVSNGVPRIAVSSDGTGAATLVSGTTQGIYAVPSTTKLSGTSTPAQPQAIYGYSNINSTDTALMLLGSGASQQFALGSGGTPLPLILFNPGTGNPTPTGEMTPNGQVAVYVPGGTNGSADTIQYANAAAVSPVASLKTVASIGELVNDPSNPGQTIYSLQDQSNAPMINSNGTTVFSALIGTTEADAQQAFLSWMPGATNPTVLIEVGDDMEIGDAPTTPADDATITDIVENDQAAESDYYRNSLNDNGEFAVGVAYTYDQNDVSGAAILVTQISTPVVPEPFTLSLVPVAGVALLARRRRSPINS